MNIRLVTDLDADKLLQVYAPYINTPITFESEVPSLQEFTNRIQSISKEYPYLCVEEDGKIVGYAYAHRFRERVAYRYSAELSIYIDSDYHSRGIGKKLISVITQILKKQGVHMLYSAVTTPNEKSERLHKSTGFCEVGTYHNAGYKCGDWHSVKWFEKEICPYSKEPFPFLEITKILASELTQLFESIEDNIT